MGCFDYTCAVSGLPIQNGEEVRFFLIQENVPNYSVRASESLWYLRTFPISARYNDYGSIEGYQDDLVLSLLRAGLTKDVVPLEQGENEYHDVPVQPDMTFEKMLVALWEKRVKVRYKMGYEAPLDYCLIREDVWQALLNLPCLDTFSYKSVKVQWFRDEALEAYDTPEPDAKIAFQDLDLWESYTNPLAKISLYNHGTFGIVKHWKLLREKNLPTQDVLPFLDTVGEFAYINLLLAHLGHRWLPSKPYGQQVGDFGAHAKFLRAMAKISANVKRAQDNRD